MQTIVSLGDCDSLETDSSWLRLLFFSALVLPGELENRGEASCGTGLGGDIRGPDDVELSTEDLFTRRAFFLRNSSSSLVIESK